MAADERSCVTEPPSTPKATSTLGSAAEESSSSTPTPQWASRRQTTGTISSKCCVVFPSSTPDAASSPSSPEQPEAGAVPNSNGLAARMQQYQAAVAAPKVASPPRPVVGADAGSGTVEGKPDGLTVAERMKAMRAAEKAKPSAKSALAKRRATTVGREVTTPTKPKRKLTNLSELRMLTAGVLRLKSEFVDSLSNVDFSETAPRADGTQVTLRSWLCRLLRQEAEFKASLPSDVSASQSDLKLLSLEQLLVIRSKTLDFQTDSRSHDAHNSFLSTADQHLFEKFARRLFERKPAMAIMEHLQPGFAKVLSTGRVGKILRHDPADDSMTYKLQFSDGNMPESDWFGRGEVGTEEEVPHAPACDDTVNTQPPGEPGDAHIAEAWLPERPEPLRLLGLRAMLILGAVEMISTGWTSPAGANTGGSVLDMPDMPELPDDWGMKLADPEQWKQNKAACFNSSRLTLQVLHGDPPAFAEHTNNGKVAVVTDRTHGTGKDRLVFWEIAVLDSGTEDIYADICRAEPTIRKLGNDLGAALARRNTASFGSTIDEVEGNQPSSPPSPEEAQPARKGRVADLIKARNNSRSVLPPVTDADASPEKLDLPPEGGKQPSSPPSPEEAQPATKGRVADLIKARNNSRSDFDLSPAVSADASPGKLDLQPVTDAAAPPEVPDLPPEGGSAGVCGSSTQAVGSTEDDGRISPDLNSVSAAAAQQEQSPTSPLEPMSPAADADAEPGRQPTVPEPAQSAPLEPVSPAADADAEPGRPPTVGYVV